MNCAEKILYGANWAYNMKLPGEALKLAAGFGGWYGGRKRCGVITGGVMVLSSLYVSRNGHESGRIKALEKEFIETFTKEMGTIDCSDLKAKYRNDEIKCNLVIFKAGEILDRIVEREGLKLNIKTPPASAGGVFTYLKFLFLKFDNIRCQIDLIFLQACC